MKFFRIIVILAMLIVVYRYYSGTHRAYKTNVSEALKGIEASKQPIITEEELIDLPVVVQNYLKYVGVVGKNKISQFILEVDGQMRLDKEKDWAPVKAEQTTFIHQGIRLFYIQ